MSTELSASGTQSITSPPLSCQPRVYEFSRLLSNFRSEPSMFTATTRLKGTTPNAGSLCNQVTVQTSRSLDTQLQERNWSGLPLALRAAVALAPCVRAIVYAAD